MANWTVILSDGQRMPFGSEAPARALYHQLLPRMGDVQLEDPDGTITGALERLIAAGIESGDNDDGEYDIDGQFDPEEEESVQGAYNRYVTERRTEPGFNTEYLTASSEIAATDIQVNNREDGEVLISADPLIAITFPPDIEPVKRRPGRPPGSKNLVR